jgi:hypothetical protein
MFLKDTYFVGSKFPKFAKKGSIAVNTTNGTINYLEPDGEWISVGGDAEGNLIVPTAIKDSSGDDFITFSRTGTGTARIGTPQDDLSLRSARDITLYAGDEGPGNVYIGWGDAEYTPDSPNRVATIGDIQSGSTGDITFDGVQIIGAGEASGDGYNNGTIEIVPDVDLYANDQYLIIDPTTPNHIHIRAGGAQDESNGHLIVGGERNNVIVSDDYRSVAVTTRPATIENTYANTNLTNSITFVTSNSSDISVGYTVNVDGTDYLVDAVTSNSPIEGMMSVTATGASFTAGNSYVFTHDPTYDNFWEFGSNGYLSGPAMGGLFVSGLLNGNGDLWINSSDKVVISGDNGVFLEDQSIPDNQVATLGDLSNFATETYVGTAVANLVDSAPATLNTLNELAAALGDNSDFGQAILTQLNNKVNTVDPSFTADDTQLSSGTFTIRVRPTLISSTSSNSFSIEAMGIQFPFRSDSGTPYYEPTSSTITFTYPESLAGAEFSVTRTNDPYTGQDFWGDFVLLSSSYQTALDYILANTGEFTSGEDFAWTGPGYGDMAVTVYVQPIDVSRIAGLTSNIQDQIDAIKAHVGMS